MGVSSPEKQAELTAYYQSISTTPLLIGQDLEPGRIMSARFPTLPPFPSAMELGAIGDEQIIYNIGKEIGTFCNKVGVNINFAPVADVNNNPNNIVIGDRSFGENPDHVAKKAATFMRGLQDAGVLACAKHFPGHGDTDVDSHHALPHIPHDRKRLDNVELYPFKQLIKKGIDAVMTAHLCVPALEPKKDNPTSLSYKVVTNLLRNELGFEGLIITDALDMQGVRTTHKPGETELRALLAGNDILLCPVDIPEAVDLIKQALVNGNLSHETLDQHVLRILLAKEQIFQYRKQIQLPHTDQ